MSGTAGQTECRGVLEEPFEKDPKLQTAPSSRSMASFVIIDPPGGTTNGFPAGTIAGSDVHDRLKAV